MVLMDFGSKIEGSAAHPANAESPMLATLHGDSNVTDSSAIGGLSANEKESPLIAEMDAGMTIDLSEKQPKWKESDMALAFEFRFGK